MAPSTSPGPMGSPRETRAVERFEHPPRVVAGLGRALQYDVVAVGMGDDVEASLELGDVLVVLAEHE